MAQTLKIHLNNNGTSINPKRLTTMALGNKTTSRSSAHRYNSPNRAEMHPYSRVSPLNATSHEQKRNKSSRRKPPYDNKLNLNTFTCIEMGEIWQEIHYKILLKQGFSIYSASYPHIIEVYAAKRASNTLPPANPITKEAETRRLAHEPFLTNHFFQTYDTIIIAHLASTHTIRPTDCAKRKQYPITSNLRLYVELAMYDMIVEIGVADM